MSFSRDDIKGGKLTRRDSSQSSFDYFAPFN